MKGKNQYQLVLVLAPKMEAKAKDAVLKNVASWVTDAGVKISKTEELGLKDLTYSIKGQKRGEFVVLEAGSDNPIQLKELNLFLNRESSIIRYLVCKK